MKAPQDISIRNLKGFPLPPLSEAHDKDDRGAVLVVAGGAQTPGAAILTGLAALRAGAGKLQLAATKVAAAALGMAVPEAAVFSVPAASNGEISAASGRVLAKPAAAAGALVIGPGMMSPAAASKLALALFAAAENTSFVVDAAALTGLDLAAAPPVTGRCRMVVTPHAGEMARLTGRTKEQILDDPAGAARMVSEALGAVVVMKGAVTYIVAPDGRSWRHEGGVIGLATSGSGDVLAGVIGGLLARGAAAETAALWGVCVHAGAGAALTRKSGAVGFLARELLAEIPPVLEAAS